MANEDIFSIVVDIVQIIAVLLVVLELAFIKRESARENHRLMKLQTMDMANSQDEGLQETNQWMRDKADLGYDYFGCPEKFKDEDIAIILYYLNRMETLSIGAMNGIYSVEIVNQISGGIIRSRFVWLAKYIQLRREIIGNENAWVSLEWLAFEIESIADIKRIPTGWRYGDNDSTPRPIDERT